VRLGSGTSWSGSPAVTTQITPANSAPVSVTINSAPSRTPLLRGDTITHTITLTNTAAESRDGINFMVFFGGASNLDAIISNGGGTATTNASSLSWTGTLPASATM